ncbi:uncharacterized protein A4U43_C03F22770 [Asparagus officinalis]|uniref:Uncharacterized protein n=1 Tax=Asparagus officinalis TaxID=4686 RepID=A0A5P1FCA0_ASPOF|nr:uncharacterized protein A4U43_C03F22770 [Asparagus officinalis]
MLLHCRVNLKGQESIVYKREMSKQMNVEVTRPKLTSWHSEKSGHTRKDCRQLKKQKYNGKDDDGNIELHPIDIAFRF